MELQKELDDKNTDIAGLRQRVVPQKHPIKTVHDFYLLPTPKKVREGRKV